MKHSVYLQRATAEIDKLANPKVRDTLLSQISKSEIELSQNLQVSNSLAAQAAEGLILTLKSKIAELIEKIHLFQNYHSQNLTTAERKKLQMIFRKAAKQEMIRVTGETNPLKPDNATITKLQEEATRQRNQNTEQRQINAILNNTQDPQTRSSPDNRGLLQLVAGKELFFRPQIQVENRDLYLQQYVKWTQNMRDLDLAHLIPDIDIASMVEETPPHEQDQTMMIFDHIHFDPARRAHSGGSSGIADSADNGPIQSKQLHEHNNLQRTIDAALERLVSGNSLNIYACVFWLLANQTSIAARDTLSNSAQIAKSLLRGIVENSVRKSDLAAEDMGQLDSLLDDCSEDGVHQRVSQLLEAYIDLLTAFLGDNAIWKDQNLGWNKRLHAMLFSLEAFFQDSGDWNEADKMVSRLKLHLKFDQRQFDILKTSFKSDMLLNDLNAKDPLRKNQNTHLARIFIDFTATHSVIYKDRLAKIRYSLTRDQLTEPQALVRHFKDLSDNLGPNSLLGKSISAPDSLQNAGSIGQALISDIFTTDSWERFENLVFTKNPGNLLEAQKMQLRDKALLLKEKGFFLRQSEDWAIKNVDGPDDTRNPADLPEEDMVSAMIKHEFRKIKATELGVQDTPHEIYKFRNLQQEQVEMGRNKDSEEIDYPEKQKMEAIEMNLQADLRFDKKTKRLVLETDLKDKNLLRKAVAFIEDGRKSTEHGKSKWEHQQDQLAKQGQYEDDVDVEHFHRKQDWQEPGFSATKPMGLESLYSSILLRRRLENFVFEGMKQKRDDDQTTNSFSNIQTDFLKFAVEHFRGSALQRILVERWVRESKEINFASREVLAGFLNQKALGHKDALKKGIEETYLPLEDQMDFSKCQDKKRTGFFYNVGDRLDKMVTFKGTTHEDEIFNLDEASRDAYKTYYDNTAADEFRRLRDLKQIGRKMQHLKHNDVGRALVNKGRDIYGEFQGLQPDHVSLNMYKIRHPDEGKLTFNSKDPSKPGYKGKLHRGRYEEMLEYFTNIKESHNDSNRFQLTEFEKMSFDEDHINQERRNFMYMDYLPHEMKNWYPEKFIDMDAQVETEYETMKHIMYGTSDQRLESLKKEVTHRPFLAIIISSS